jgi:hypothetical protein
MSIATDEAEKKYPAPTDADDPMYKYVESIAGYPTAKRQGYVAGRTAEPTEAEIEAGAMAIFRTLTTSAHPMSDSDYAEAWNCIAPMQKDKFKRQSQAVLEAARKAVAE